MDNPQVNSLVIGGVSTYNGQEVPNDFLFKILMENQALQLKNQNFVEKEARQEKYEQDKTQKFKDFASYVLPLVSAFFGGEKKPCGCQEPGPGEPENEVDLYEVSKSRMLEIIEGWNLENSDDPIMVYLADFND
jgi:hypothetical protein